MATYFMPLRRKIGVLTLILAGMFMAGWMRSPVIHDTFTVCFGSTYRFKLVSAARRLGFAILHINSDELLPFAFWTADTAATNGWRIELLPSVPRLSDGIEKGILRKGNGEAHFSNTSIRADWFHVPYYSIVIPLTLLSAWLLLSKRRQPTITESTI